MVKAFRRITAIFVLIAALSNGLLGPLAHGHGMTAAVQLPEAQVSAQVSPTSHGGCHAHEAEDEDLPAKPGNGKNAGLLCSGSAACCAAVAVLDLPAINHRARVAPQDYLRPVLTGLSPPVGDRPPSHV
jgi:hypothetical protein